MKAPLESELVEIVAEAIKVANTARKHKKSITTGSNFYVTKFSELKTKSIVAVENLHNHFSDNPQGNHIFAPIESTVVAFFDSSVSDMERFKIGKKIISDFKILVLPFLITTNEHPPTDRLFPKELVKNTRGNIEKIGSQALGCYDFGWYDACAVMIRRLLENLIIECFETHQIASKIKNSDDNFFYLQDLISKFLNDNEGKWNASRNTKNTLPSLKDIGDKSAHSRYFTARQSDIDNVKNDLRTIIEELVVIGKLKK